MYRQGRIWFKPFSANWAPKSLPSSRLVRVCWRKQDHGPSPLWNMWRASIVCVAASLLWNSLLMKVYKNENASPLAPTFPPHSLLFSKWPPLALLAGVWEASGKSRLYLGSRFLTCGLYSRLQFLCVSLCLHLCLSLPLFVSLCVSFSTYLSICLSWSLSVALSVCTSLPVILCLSLYLLFFWLLLHLSIVLSLSVCVSPSGFLFLTPFLSFPRSLIGEDIKISAILSDCVLVILRQNEDLWFFFQMLACFNQFKINLEAIQPQMSSCVLWRMCPCFPAGLPPSIFFLLGPF